MLKLLELKLLVSATLLLVTIHSKADYLDVTYSNKLNIDTKFMTKKIIFAASVKGDKSSIGAGVGWRDKEFQIYGGLSYRDDNSISGFLHGFYKSGRHVYEIESILIKNSSQVKFCYNKLITESFGFYGKVSTKGKVTVGLRKWF